LLLRIRWILSDSGAAAAFVGNARHAEAIGLAQVPNLEAAWVLDGGGLDALARVGAGVTADQVLRRRRRRGHHEPARRAADRLGGPAAARLRGAGRADGEIEVQGPVTFGGYWHDPQATSDAFDGRCCAPETSADSTATGSCSSPAGKRT
jgi:acyl-CoA synthetase (AMP-forming)/AMP-acid ligase II